MVKDPDLAGLNKVGEHDYLADSLLPHHAPEVTYHHLVGACDTQTVFKYQTKANSTGFSFIIDTLLLSRPTWHLRQIQK